MSRLIMKSKRKPFDALKQKPPKAGETNFHLKTANFHANLANHYEKQGDAEKTKHHHDLMNHHEAIHFKKPKKAKV